MTRPIGLILLDEKLLSKDIDEVEKFKMAQIYSEYSRGNPGWKSAVLFNQSGVEGEAYIKSYEGQGKFTPLAERVPYIREIVEHYFDRRLLLWARVMCVKNGFIMPHRDYLDVDGGLVRVHIPIQTDSSCINTEEDRAFHMNIGEVCFLDGAKAHAAACLSDFHRIHVCLDFRPTTQFCDLFRQKDVYFEDGQFEEVQRESLDANFEAGVLELSRFLDDASFFEISGIMGLVHFRRNVNCRKTYDWLREAAKLTGSQALVYRADKLREEFLGVQVLKAA